MPRWRFLIKFSIDFCSLFYEKLHVYGYMKQFKKIMNAEFLSRLVSCINNGEVVFGEYAEVRRFYAPLIKMIWTTEGSSRGIKSTTQNSLTYGNVTYRITAKWLFVLVFARRGWATSFRVQRQKGILKYEQELRQKGPLYTSSILRRCTIAVAPDYAIVSSFLFTGL